MKENQHTSLWLAVILGASALGLYIGWREFWFLTDDAFIAFRYISNDLFGFGYVWNPPPFLPVEGYTSFLWVVLLDLIWRFFGIEPPASANTVSLFFSYGTLILTALAFWRMTLPKKFARIRPVLLILILVGILSNRTFLAWSSSGLETALFNFCLTYWIFAMIFIGRDSRLRTLHISLAASLTYLARPDGILMVIASLGVLVLEQFGSWNSVVMGAKRLLWALPLAIVPAHLLWRRSFYGAWLPNTYYAKYVSPWPEAGIRYLASFILEYALWFWLAVLIYWVWLSRFVGQSQRRTAKLSVAPAAPRNRLGLIIASFAIILQVLYYTLIIGGDHFEYRVYSHLVPLILLTFVWMIARIDLRPSAVVGTVAAFILLSLPIPWTHYSLSQKFTTRNETLEMKIPVAEHFPSFIQWYPAAFDRLQSWLIEHSVCMRHQEHKIFCEHTLATHPSRSEGSQIDAGVNPVIQAWTVGVTGWVLPHVAVLDLLGLSDYVIARMPPIPDRKRQMAHERTPPIGYIESYDPNVSKSWRGVITVRARENALTNDSITVLEHYWRQRIKVFVESLASDRQ